MEQNGFIISLSLMSFILVLAVLAAVRPYKQRSLLKAFHLIFGGVFICATIAFIPLYSSTFRGDSGSFLTVILSSVHNAIRLYIVDCDMSFVIEQTAHLDLALRSAYRVYMNALMVVAPILTAVGVIMTFLTSMSAVFKYALFSYFKDAYVFSELNERSLALAKSIKEKNKSSALLFMDVFRNDDEKSFELNKKAKELGAILFKTDVTMVDLYFHSKARKLYFFIIGEDAQENLNQVIQLASPRTPKHLFRKKDAPKPTFGYDYYRGPDADTRIYLFSSDFGTEQSLSAINPTHIKIRRVNEIQSMIYNLLNTHGSDIFDSARETGSLVHNSAYDRDDGEKLISALVIGMGLHGTEMVKSLTWFGQMHPYKLEINVIDRDPDAASHFQSGYPDLFDCNPPSLSPDDKRKYHNGDYETPGEAHYKISVYSGIDATLSEFDEKIKALKDTTYIFVALGCDDLNIKVATKLRILYRRMKLDPVIHTIVCDPNSYNALKDGKTASGDSYSIIPYGNMSDVFSADCILGSELEAKALERHMRYANHVVESQNIQGEERKRRLAAEEETFWRYDYNYRSSIASAIHTDFKKKYNIPGSDKTPDQRTEPEKWFYRRLEHNRWNAYVRSEGYVYAPVRDKLAKTHHLLVPFDQLSYEEQIKDDD